MARHHGGVDHRPLQIGVGLAQSWANPAVDLIADARRAEALGFDSIWLSDPGRGGPQMLDPVATLAAAAAATERVGLGVSVLVLPTHHPIRLAQSLADGMNRARKQEAAGPELKALDDRLARLRRRLKDGDPDLDADELKTAIAAAEAKRAKLAKPARASVSVLATLPEAAARLHKRIARGINAKGDLIEAAKARDILRQLLGEIRISVDAEGVWAEFEAQPEKILLANHAHCPSRQRGNTSFRAHR